MIKQVPLVCASFARRLGGRARGPIAPAARGLPLPGGWPCAARCAPRRGWLTSTRLPLLTSAVCRPNAQGAAARLWQCGRVPRCLCCAACGIAADSACSVLRGCFPTNPAAPTINSLRARCGGAALATRWSRLVVAVQRLVSWLSVPAALFGGDSTVNTAAPTETARARPSPVSNPPLARAGPGAQGLRRPGGDGTPGAVAAPPPHTLTPAPLPPPPGR